MILSAAVLALAGAVLAQGVAVPYCADLKNLNNLAMSRGRFGPIIGDPREGNFRETKLALTGWMNCAFYGRRPIPAIRRCLKRRKTP
jgi:hypothetical protein